jgi:hypothetical protein
MKRKTKTYLLIAGIGIITILTFSVVYQYTLSTTSNNYLRLMNKNDLEREKLIQEIEKAKSMWNGLSNQAPFIAALVALLGLFVTIWKQIGQKRYEIQIRKEEKFELIAENLSSDNEAIRTTAAVLIFSFLKDDYTEFHEQVYIWYSWAI